MVEEGKAAKVSQEQALEVQHIRKRVDMLDQRLDSIDSMVSAVAERVMRQPITLNLTCPHCGKDIEIALIGTRKPAR